MVQRHSHNVVDDGAIRRIDCLYQEPERLCRGKLRVPCRIQRLRKGHEHITPAG